MKGGTKGKTTVPFLKAVFGKEKSSVQFRPLEEQIYRAMATLFDQKQRHGVARLVGERMPVKIVTPKVEQWPTPPAMAHSFLTRCYEKLPFALRSEEAHKQIADRHQKIVAGMMKPTAAEPIAIKRKIS